MVITRFNRAALEDISMVALMVKKGQKTWQHFSHVVLSTKTRLKCFLKMCLCFTLRATVLSKCYLTISWMSQQWNDSFCGCSSKNTPVSYSRFLYDLLLWCEVYALGDFIAEALCKISFKAWWSSWGPGYLCHHTCRETVSEQRLKM